VTVEIYLALLARAGARPGRLAYKREDFFSATTSAIPSLSAGGARRDGVSLAFGKCLTGDECAGRPAVFFTCIKDTGAPSLLCFRGAGEDGLTQGQGLFMAERRASMPKADVAGGLGAAGAIAFGVAHQANPVAMLAGGGEG